MQELPISSFPSGFEGGMWNVIVLIPDHCLFIYFLFSEHLDDRLVSF